MLEVLLNSGIIGISHLYSILRNKKISSFLKFMKSRRKIIAADNAHLK